MFFALLVGHAVLDFALQPTAMAIEKNRHSTTPLQKSVPWYYWLSAHALGHGGAVYVVTNSLALGVLETAVHWLIDFAKCEEWTTIHIDQLLHVISKVAWCALIVFGFAGQLDALIPALGVARLLGSFA